MSTSPQCGQRPRAYRALRWLCGLLVVTAGVASNLGSNFVGSPGEADPLYGTCAPGNLLLKPTPGTAPSGAAGAPLGATQRVQVVCRTSDGSPQPPVAGAWVQWVSRSGSVDGAVMAISTTDAQGFAEVNWSLGPATGSQVLLAQAAGNSLEIRATSLPPTTGGTCAAGAGTVFDNLRKIRGAERWTLAGSPYRGSQVELQPGAELSIDPGVQVCVKELRVQAGARLLAQGEAGREMVFGVANPSTDSWSLMLAGGSAAGATLPQSVLQHVRIENLVLLEATDHPLRVEDSQLAIHNALRASSLCAQVVMRDSGAPSLMPSSVQRSVFDGYGGTADSCDVGVRLESLATRTAGASRFEARVVNGPRDGVRVASLRGVPAWALTRCDISRNGRDGLVFADVAIPSAPFGTSPGATVSGCSITDNGGLGIRNVQEGRYVVDARGVWWGDPAGPGGATGDGSSGGVDSQAALSAAPVLGY